MSEHTPGGPVDASAEEPLPTDDASWDKPFPPTRAADYQNPALQRNRTCEACE